jgi:hypothetical protein
MAGWFLVLISLGAFAKSHYTYQDGKVLSVKRSEQASLFLEQHPNLQNQVDYDIAIQVGDTIYTCRYTVFKGDSLDWLVGRTLQVYPQKRVMQFKDLGGSPAGASIMSKAPAPAAVPAPKP